MVELGMIYFTGIRLPVERNEAKGVFLVLQSWRMGPTQIRRIV